MDTVVVSLQAADKVGPDSLNIAGFVPFSTVDWPDKLAATLFLQGCPWRCTYCHNPDLQNPRTVGPYQWADVYQKLAGRVGLLDGVVFSGGEPTRQPALEPAMAAVKQLGFAVGLHTAGCYPTALSALLPQVDWVGLDIKATPEQYREITGVESASAKARQSLALVQSAGVDYEVRVTVDPTVHTRADIFALLDELAGLGVTDPILQSARALGADPAYATALQNRTIYDVIPASELTRLGYVVRD